MPKTDEEVRAQRAADAAPEKNAQEAQDAHVPLVVISSRTGNTMILGHAITDALPGAVLMRTSEVPEDLERFNPVLLGFWCDRGDAPEDMRELAKRLHGKRIACFATMGGDPDKDAWMHRASESLVAAGSDNELVDIFLCRGRIDPEVFERMTTMLGGNVSPERESRRRESETHPDRTDLARGAVFFRSVFGMNF